MFSKYSGDIAKIATNADGLYEGDLRRYVKVILQAPNIYNGYHGLRHMLHVLWVCYQACEYYARLGKLTPPRMRRLLIAAIFHDYYHSGKSGDDKENIAEAIKGLRFHLLVEDYPYLEEIENILRATQFPHEDLGSTATLEQRILRDADVSQAFGPVWIGDILAGFGSELEKTPLEMLKQQLGFLNTLKFHSDFGKVFYGEDALHAKKVETMDLIAILET